MKTKANFLVALAVLVLTAAYFVSYSNFFGLFHFPIDDAWIHRVYSRSFALGKGLQYASGFQETGETSPLWAIVSAPAHWFEWLGTGVVVIAVKGINLALAALIVWLVVSSVSRLTGSKLAGGIAGVLLALDARLHFSIFSGMETILLVAVWLVVIYSLLYSRWLLSAVAVGLTATVRPEAALLIPIWLLLLLQDARSIGVRKVGLCALISGLPLFLWGVFCKVVTGSWLPNTFHRKASGLSFDNDNLLALWDILSVEGYTIGVVFWIGVTFASLLALRPATMAYRRVYVMGVTAPLFYWIAIVASRELRTSGYYWTRWIDPASLVMTAIVCGVIGATGAVILGRLVVPKSIVSPIVGKLLSLLVVIAFLLQAGQIGASVEHRRRRLVTDSRVIFTNNELPGKWLNQNSPSTAYVGVVDAGATPYLSHRRVVDLEGLNESKIALGARSPQEYLKEVDYLVMGPHFVHLFGVRDDFVEAKEFRVLYKEYTVCDCPQQTTMVIYKRRGLTPQR